MLKNLPCTSWDTAELYNILLNTTKNLVRHIWRTISVFSIILLNNVIL